MMVERFKIHVGLRAGTCAATRHSTVRRERTRIIRGVALLTSLWGYKIACIFYLSSVLLATPGHATHAARLSSLSAVLGAVAARGDAAATLSEAAS